MIYVLCNNSLLCYCYFLLLSATLSISDLTPDTNTGWGWGRGDWKESCREGIWGSWWTPTCPYVGNGALQQMRPTASWAALGRVLPAAQRRRSSPSAQPWGDKSRVLGPMLDSPVQERCGFTGLSPVNGHEFIGQKEVTEKSGCCVIKSGHQQCRLYQPKAVSMSQWHSLGQSERLSVVPVLSSEPALPRQTNNFRPRTTCVLKHFKVVPWQILPYSFKSATLRTQPLNYGCWCSRLVSHITTDLKN